MNARRTFAVDQEEAIDNLDRAFDGLLTSLHSLYDAMKLATLQLDWHAHGDTAACILVRNARHHNADNLFESWNSRMIKFGGLKKMSGASFLLVGYRLVEEGLGVSEYYVPFDDFRARLAMPEARLKDPQAVSKLLEQDCGFKAIRDHAANERYPIHQVYLNLVPLVMNATSRAFDSLQSAGVTPTGYDSSVYFPHFGTKLLVDTHHPTYKSIRVDGR